MTASRRILGVDVGTVRIGVALSDPLGMIASPFEVIERYKVDPFARLATLVQDNEVVRVLVGMPLTLSGEVGPAAQGAEVFIKELEKRLLVPVKPWDERLTTAAAQRSMIEGGARRAERKQKIDKVAAAILLQSYLDAGSPA